MNFSYISLDPVPVSKPGPHAAKELRTHQGIPGIECSASGRLFAVWYAGGNGECRENYVTMAVSDDHGATWKDSVAVVDPPHPDVRAFDSVLWRSPDGRFFWFWSQGCGPCVQSIPELEKISAFYADRLAVISISSDPKDQWLAFLKEKGLKGHQWNELRNDGAGLAAAYNVHGIPHYVLIAPDGKVQDVWNGYGEGSLERKMKEHLK